MRHKWILEGSLWFAVWWLGLSAIAAPPTLGKRDVRNLERTCARGMGPSCGRLAEGALRGEGKALPRDSEVALGWARAGCRLDHVESCVLRSTLMVELGRVRRGDVPTVLAGFEQGCEAAVQGACAAWSQFVHDHVAVWSPSPDEQRADHRRACARGAEAGCVRAAALDGFLQDEAVPWTLDLVPPALELADRMRSCLVRAAKEAPVDGTLVVRGLVLPDRTLVRTRGLPAHADRLQGCAAAGWADLHDTLAAGPSGRVVEVSVDLTGGLERPVRAHVPVALQLLDDECASGQHEACVSRAVQEGLLGLSAVPACASIDPASACKAPLALPKAPAEIVAGCFEELTTRRKGSGGRVHVWLRPGDPVPQVDPMCTDLPDPRFHGCVLAALIDVAAPGSHAACLELEFAAPRTKQNMFGN